MNAFKTKRIFDKADDDDGYRVLIDRLWPRGVSKVDAKLDEWLKELGPTDELRKWFGHDPGRFTTFKSKYKEQLKSEKRQEALNQIKQMAQEKQVTLLFAAKEEKYNHAQVVREVLEDGD